MPASRTASATPFTSGASGPITTRPQPVSRAKSATAEDVYKRQAERLRPYICETGLLLNNLVEEGKEILFEGCLLYTSGSGLRALT